MKSETVFLTFYALYLILYTAMAIKAKKKDEQHEIGLAELARSTQKVLPVSRRRHYVRGSWRLPHKNDHFIFLLAQADVIVVFDGLGNRVADLLLPYGIDSFSVTNEELLLFRRGMTEKFKLDEICWSGSSDCVFCQPRVASDQAEVFCSRRWLTIQSDGKRKRYFSFLCPSYRMMVSLAGVSNYVWLITGLKLLDREAKTAFALVNLYICIISIRMYVKKQ